MVQAIVSEAVLARTSKRGSDGRGARSPRLRWISLRAGPGCAAMEAQIQVMNQNIKELIDKVKELDASNTAKTAEIAALKAQAAEAQERK